MDKETRRLVMDNIRMIEHPHWPKVSDSFVINNNYIYSCYFKRAIQIMPDNRLISIARWAPSNYKGLYMPELRPPRDLFWAYKMHDIDFLTFSDLYFDRVLADKDPEAVYQAIKGKVICCWEKPEESCHRHVVMKWLQLAIPRDIMGGEI